MHVTVPPPEKVSMGRLLQEGHFLQSYYPLLSPFQHLFVGCMMYYNANSVKAACIFMNYYDLCTLTFHCFHV